MTPRLLQIFNRYRERGGEEKSVERIYRHVSEMFPTSKCWFHSEEWIKETAPPRWKQALLIGRNRAALERIRTASRQAGACLWMTHNLIPVASFGVYGEALRLGIPIIQFVHNFRPFSPGGSLWLGDRVCDDALHGKLWPELRAGSWQGSVLKTAILAWHVKRLFHSGDLDAVTHWVTISEFMRDRFIEGGIPAERVVTLRHSWDARPAAPDAADGGYYLLLARLVTEKGVRVTVEAWKRMEKEAGPNCPRLVIGGTGPLNAEVAAAAAEHKGIDYLGFVDGDAKDELIANCRAMLAPSVWWEPLGLITYEAYDAAKPILAADSGGLAETVVEGETGFLHRAGDVEDLITSVRRMEDLPYPERREMGARGREWLLREADPALWKERFREVLRLATG